MGRFEGTGRGARSSWSGASLHTRVEGTGANLRLAGDEGIYFEVFVDGASERVFFTQEGERSYPLFAGKPRGTHEVVVYRRNEATAGVFTYLAFEPPPAVTAAASGATDWRLVPSPRPFRHRIEVLGDSITCGYGADGPEGCTFSNATESAYLTYAAIAARAVGAEAHLVCYSGKGLLQNYGGNRFEPMPELYGRTLLQDTANDTWDFGRYRPEAVVINLGTNDISADFEDEDFIGAYLKLLRRVRRLHPEALIVAVRWKHWGPSKTALVREAVKRFGDDHTEELLFDVRKGEGHGCDKHPSRATHQRLGETLAQLLASHLDGEPAGGDASR